MELDPVFEDRDPDHWDHGRVVVRALMCQARAVLAWVVMGGSAVRVQIVPPSPTWPLALTFDMHTVLRRLR